jgi:hypothetical protein
MKTLLLIGNYLERFNIAINRFSSHKLMEKSTIKTF